MGEEHLSCDHDTKFIVHVRSIRMQKRFVGEDENGGQDYEFRTVAVYRLVRKVKRPRGHLKGAVT